MSMIPMTRRTLGRGIGTLAAAGALGAYASRNRSAQAASPEKETMTETTTASKIFEDVLREPVVFRNEELGTTLAGIIFRPKNLTPDTQVPGILVAGQMYAPKELAQSLYAQRLAQQGYVTMVWDYSYIGSSSGQPRGLEDPAAKKADIKAATDFFRTVNGVDPNRIAAWGICGSGAYMAYAAVEDPRLKVYVGMVPFTLMDTVHTMSREEAEAAKAHFESTGEAPELLALIEEGSEGAAYYRQWDRGASANYVDAVAWSQMYWWDFNPINFAGRITQPALIIVGENAFTRAGDEEMYARLGSEVKLLHVTPEATHFSMYDQ